MLSLRQKGIVIILKFRKLNFRSKGQGARGKRLPPSLKMYLLAFILFSIVFNYSLAPCSLPLEYSQPRTISVPAWDCFSPTVGTIQSQRGS